MTAPLVAILVALRAAFVACLLWTAGAHAQALPSAAAVSASAVQTTGQALPAPPEAVLRYANRAILTLQVPYLGMPPSERVRRAQGNIDRALAQGGPGELSARTTPQGQLVFVDGVMALILFEGDVAPMSGDTLTAPEATRCAPRTCANCTVLASICSS